HRVLAAAVELGVSLLPSEPADLGDGHADDADPCESLLHLLELEMLDDAFVLFHGGRPAGQGAPGVPPRPDGRAPRKSARYETAPPMSWDAALPTEWAGRCGVPRR